MNTPRSTTICKQQSLRVFRSMFLFMMMLLSWSNVAAFQSMPLGGASSCKLQTPNMRNYAAALHKTTRCSTNSRVRSNHLNSQQGFNPAGGSSTISTQMMSNGIRGGGGERFQPSISKPPRRTTAVYGLILVNLAVFILDKVLRNPIVRRRFYLFHNNHRWHWWQLLTTCFCHADRLHLSNNLFLLLLFGRSVEDDLGWGGLLWSFTFCGVASSLVSICCMPQNTVSIGASGAVFGLFAVSTLGKLSWRQWDWRKMVEIAVLGEFVFRQVVSEVATATRGGTAGVNHVAHLSGAAAGAFFVLMMQSIVGRFERNNELLGSK